LRAAGDLADGRALGVGDGVALARDAAPLPHQPDAPAPRAALRLRRARAAPAALALAQPGDPAHAPLERRPPLGPPAPRRAAARLERGRSLGQLVAVEAVAGLQPGRVARAEPGGLEPERRAGLQERLPDGLDALGLTVDLEPRLAGVAGVREERALTAEER